MAKDLLQTFSRILCLNPQYSPRRPFPSLSAPGLPIIERVPSKSGSVMRIYRGAHAHIFFFLAAFSPGCTFGSFLHWKMPRYQTSIGGHFVSTQFLCHMRHPGCLPALPRCCFCCCCCCCCCLCCTASPPPAVAVVAVVVVAFMISHSFSFLLKSSGIIRWISSTFLELWPASALRTSHSAT